MSMECLCIYRSFECVDGVADGIQSIMKRPSATLKSPNFKVICAYVRAYAYTYMYIYVAILAQAKPLSNCPQTVLHAVRCCVRCCRLPGRHWLAVELRALFPAEAPLGGLAFRQRLAGPPSPAVPPWIRWVHAPGGDARGLRARVSVRCVEAVRLGSPHVPGLWQLNPCSLYCAGLRLRMHGRRPPSSVLRWLWPLPGCLHLVSCDSVSPLMRGGGGRKCGVSRPNWLRSCWWTRLNLGSSLTRPCAPLWAFPYLHALARWCVVSFEVPNGCFVACSSMMSRRLQRRQRRQLCLHCCLLRPLPGPPPVLLVRF